MASISGHYGRESFKQVVFLFGFLFAWDNFILSVFNRVALKKKHTTLQKWSTIKLFLSSLLGPLLQNIKLKNTLPLLWLYLLKLSQKSARKITLQDSFTTIMDTIYQWDPGDRTMCVAHLHLYKKLSHGHVSAPTTPGRHRRERWPVLYAICTARVSWPGTPCVLNTKPS